MKNRSVFLEEEALANSNIITNLQRDNSSLIKTVEMLSEQLLNLNLSENKGKTARIVLKAMAHSTTEVHNKNEKKEKDKEKKGKGQENGISPDNVPASDVPRDASLPRDAPLPRNASSSWQSLSTHLNKAGGKAIPSNKTENMSSSRNKKKGVVVGGGHNRKKTTKNMSRRTHV